MTGKVLLVHGLLNATSWLRPLAARLRAHGVAPELFGYSSRSARCRGWWSACVANRWMRWSGTAWVA